MSTFQIEVIIDGPIKIVQQEQASGWSDRAMSLLLDGRPMEITIRKDDQTEIGFHINEQGRITITGYGNAYTMFAPNNLQLTPTRPWKP